MEGGRSPERRHEGVREGTVGFFVYGKVLIALGGGKKEVKEGGIVCEDGRLTAFLKTTRKQQKRKRGRKKRKKEKAELRAITSLNRGGARSKS